MPQCDSNKIHILTASGPYLFQANADLLPKCLYVHVYTHCHMYLMLCMLSTIHLAHLNLEFYYTPIT